MCDTCALHNHGTVAQMRAEMEERLKSGVIPPFPTLQQFFCLSDSEVAKLDRRVVDDRERRPLMGQRGLTLLDDRYPDGIDAGPSYRGELPPINERNWQSYIASRKPKAIPKQKTIVPVEIGRKLKEIE